MRMGGGRRMGMEGEGALTPRKGAGSIGQRARGRMGGGTRKLAKGTSGVAKVPSFFEVVSELRLGLVAENGFMI